MCNKLHCYNCENPCNPWFKLQNESKRKENDMQAKGLLLRELRISNGISFARIFSMFWIFMVNYFSTGIFRNYYKVEYQYAIEKGENFLKVMNTSPSFLDKSFFALSYAGWSGVIAFFFLSGFSLWFSILKRKTFNIVGYAVRRFKSIYPTYLMSVVITVAVVIMRKTIIIKSKDVAALIVGAAKFVSNAQDFNSPFWFITAISMCYLFFPLLPMIYSRFKFTGLLAFVVVNYIFFRVPVLSDTLYPLIPFFVYVCIGVLACHIIFRYLAKNEAIMKLFCIFAIIVGYFVIYRYVYGEPVQKCMQTTWALSHPYEAGVVFAAVFFAAGYLLPAVFNKGLIWLSRGTLAVFLYHYLLYPDLVPILQPRFFGGHLSLMFICTYVCFLLFFSFLQGLFDKKIGRRVSETLTKHYNFD